VEAVEAYTVHVLTNEAYFTQLEKNFADGLALMRAKNADYAGSIDPFGNFRLAPMAAGVSIAQGMLVRMSDKMARTAQLLKQKGYAGKVKDETIHETVRDLMNYSNILLTWLQSEGLEGESNGGQITV
jgi:hypothetical protein